METGRDEEREREEELVSLSSEINGRRNAKMQDNIVDHHFFNSLTERHPTKSQQDLRKNINLQ